MVISHLQFANDTIIFCNNSQRQIRLLVCVLRCFKAVSGLRLNFEKSTLFAVGDLPNLDQLAVDFDCKKGALPTKYLGLPLGSTHKQKEILHPVLDKMICRLNGWKARYLSLYELPASVCHKMKRIQWDFLWRGGSEMDRGMHLVAWDKVCIPKGKGGAGLRRLQPKNQAFLCKWFWRFDLEEDFFWRKVVSAKYGVRDGWDLSVPRGAYGCSPWCVIMKHLVKYWL